MKSVDNLVKLAERFARKISLAQQTAQAGEIEGVLKEGRVWYTENDLFPLADEAGVPAGIAIFFNIVVDKNLDVTFRATPSSAPPASIIKMNKLLKDKFGPSMKQALQTITIKERNDKGQVISQRPVSVTNPVVVKWHGLK